MYSGEVVLSGHNVLHVMYAAKKYLLDDLVERCSKFLEEELSEENVCSILNHCLLYDEKTLLNKCETFITHYKMAVIVSPDVLNLEKDTLHHLLSMKLGHCTEAVDTFRYCLRWAKSRQINKDEVVSLRNIMGDCLFQIQFSSMAAPALASILGDEPDVLNDKEQATLFKYIACPGKREKAAVSALGFTHVEIKAQIQDTINRFTTVHITSKTWSGSKHKPDVIDLKVNQDMKFHGVTL
jgi:hypothetical protein